MFIYIISAIVLLFLYIFILKPLTPLLKIKIQLGKDARLEFKPLIGGFLRLQRELKRNNNIYDLIFKFAMTPPTHKVRLGNFLNVPVIGFTDPFYYKQILINHEKYTKFDTFRHDDFIREGLLFTSGAKWSQQRQLLGHAFKADQLKDRVPMINQVSQKILNNIENDNIIDLFHSITGQIVIKSFFSDDLQGIQLNGKSLELEIVSLLNDIAAEKFNFVKNLKSVFLKKEWRKYFMNQKEKKLDQRLANLKQVAKEAIEKRIAKETDKAQQDFLDIYIEAYKAQKLSIQITFSEIIDQFITLFSAGTDTTSLLTINCIYFLAKHPENASELLKELSEVVGDGDVKFEQLAQLKKMQAFINETLRLRNPAPKLIGRIAKEDHYLNDIFIKKGINSSKIGQMITIENYYQFWNSEKISNPDQFDYKRWLREDLMAKSDSFDFIPFSAGGRNCIGQHMALIEAKIILAHVLRMFDLYIREGVKVGWIIKLLTQITPENAIILKRK